MSQRSVKNGRILLMNIAWPKESSRNRGYRIQSLSTISSLKPLHLYHFSLVLRWVWFLIPLKDFVSKSHVWKNFYNEGVGMDSQSFTLLGGSNWITCIGNVKLMHIPNLKHWNSLKADKMIDDCQKKDLLERNSCLEDVLTQVKQMEKSFYEWSRY